MTDDVELMDGEGTDEASGEPQPPAPPITDRFLFVDVAALRAKQLRRGALPRLGTDVEGVAPAKAERIAMEEVRRGLVHYDVPVYKPKTHDQQV